VTDILFDDPCLLFALGREAQFFRQRFPAQERFPDAPCQARFCGPAWLSVLVVEMGIGRQRTEKALTWLLNQPQMGNVPYRPKVVISAGFSGALREGLRVGDIILATEVADAEGHCWPTTWPEELPAGEWRPPLHRGRLLSVPHFAAHPEEKRRLGNQYEAAAVDMETAVVARLCRNQQVPFACVRVISDEVDTALSAQLVSLFEGERVAPVRLLAALAKQPGLAGELWRLARDTRYAGRQLALALGELLTLTLPWAAD
jgi:nucleoside phosphorylase